ncbi:MAG TPA: hypothetical protein VFQ92_04845 [Blastocatellia bacterium]|nr:hypothetical protein [Blastocatellia bacterium]
MILLSIQYFQQSVVQLWSEYLLEQIADLFNRLFLWTLLRYSVLVAINDSWQGNIAADEGQQVKVAGQVMTTTDYYLALVTFLVLPVIAKLLRLTGSTPM